MAAKDGPESKLREERSAGVRAPVELETGDFGIEKNVLKPVGAAL